jgi:geranylgeranyl diphosphate synthase, type II
MDFIQVLKERKPKIYEKILEYLPEKFPEEHYNMVRDYPERQGKYFRPVLVLLANEMFGGSEEKAILTAAGMQLSEDWLLVHDDVEDGSEERRGKPALNKMYGIELAVNAGDALHMIMWKTLFDNNKILDEETSEKVFNLMYDILMRTSEGQYLDISWVTHKKVDITEEEYYNMIDRKTAAYTIYGPIQLGATVAGATDSQIRSIREWGTPFGRAFQIHDDVLNLVANQEKYGKEIGGDILEGKRTLILVHLLSNCTSDEKRKIIGIYEKDRKDKTEEEKKYVMNMMKRYGSIDYAHRKSLEYTDQAKVLFDKNTSMLKDTFAKKAIKAGMDFVVNRDK